MNPNDNTAIQLNSLVTEYRAKADFIALSVDLQSNGYKQDQTRIDTEVKAYKDSKDAEITTLKATITDLQNQINNPKPIPTDPGIPD